MSGNHNSRDLSDAAAAWRDVAADTREMLLDSIPPCYSTDGSSRDCEHCNAHRALLALARAADKAGT